MATQTALVVQKIGEPVVAVHDWPIPHPGPKQIQVRVTIAGLNPHDQKGRDRGLLVSEELPGILGSDVVGVVTATGHSSSRFRIGDRVFAQSSITRGYTTKALQQFAVLDEDFAAVVPEGLSDDDVATLPTNLLAGVFGLFSAQGLGLPAPWTEEGSANTNANLSILIVGGGSNCGRFVTQLAKLAGFGTVVVVGGDEQELKSYGATHVVDRRRDHDTILQEIRDIVGDELIYAFDTYNGPPGQHLAINALSSSQKGKLVRLTWTRGELDQDRIHDKNAGYDLRQIFGVSSLQPEFATPFWQHLTGYLTDKKIRPLKYVVEQGLDADKVNEVLDRYRDGKPVVQTHFRVSE